MTFSAVECKYDPKLIKAFVMKIRVTSYVITVYVRAGIIRALQLPFALIDHEFSLFLRLSFKLKV